MRRARGDARLHAGARPRSSFSVSDQASAHPAFAVTDHTPNVLLPSSTATVHARAIVGKLARTTKDLTTPTRPWSANPPPSTFFPAGQIAETDFARELLGEVWVTVVRPLTPAGPAGPAGPIPGPSACTTPRVTLWPRKQPLTHVSEAVMSASPFTSTRPLDDGGDRLAEPPVWNRTISTPA